MYIIGVDLSHDPSAIARDFVGIDSCTGSFFLVM